MRVVGHCLVKNEENFVWYALNSVIDCLDEILVWDNGSQDKTPQIVKSIQNPKIRFAEKGRTSAEGTARLRQQMLERTQADWIFIIDGDEVWWEEGIKNVRTNIEEAGKSEDLIVSPVYMLIGDIFHYQEEKAGQYRIGSKVGHYNLRAIRKTPGLHVEGAWPDEAYINSTGQKVQNLPEKRVLFAQDHYLHCSHLRRSSQDQKKFKYEIGQEFPRDFYYPEVFFKSRPIDVSNPWVTMDWAYRTRAQIETPLKRIKRRLI